MNRPWRGSVLNLRIAVQSTGWVEMISVSTGGGLRPSGNSWSTAIESLTPADGLNEQSNVADSFRNGRLEFHSTLWSIWSYFGHAGLADLALALLIAFFHVRANNSLTLSVAIELSLLSLEQWQHERKLIAA